MKDYREFRRGWPLVLASTVGVALGLSPIPFYELGLFVPEFMREFHWGVGTIMGGVLFNMFGILAAGPVIGLLVDRYGARRVTLTSIVAFGLSLSLFAWQSGSVPLYYATWFLMSLAGAGTLPITWTRAINQAFDARKGLALGLTLAGSGVSGFFLKPITAWLIAGQGWRTAFLFLALMPLLVSLPLAWACFRTPAADSKSAGPIADLVAAQGPTFTQALRDLRFWIIGLGTLPVAFAVAGPIPNLETILTARGVARETILGVVPFLGLAVIAGRLGCGWLLDRVWAPAIALCLFAVSAASMWLLVNGPASTSLVWFGVIGIGMLAGLEFDLVAFLTARYFGTRHYGSIYGTLYAFFIVGAGVAPLVYGRVFDATKSFAGIVSVGAFLILLGGVMLLTLGRYRYQAGAGSTEPVQRPVGATRA